MFSLKKSIGITVVALILGVFAGFNFGKITSKDDNVTPERITDSAIQQGAASIGTVADTANKPEIKENKEVATPPPPPPQNVSEDNYTITVNDQDAGSAVSVSSVATQKPVWVAIHEEAGSGPGKILGAQLFDSTMHSGKVELLRNTESGRTYYAVFHHDNGGRGFDYEKNTPIKDSSGREIMAKFNTSNNPVLHQ